MWPTVDCDRGNVAFHVEANGTERTVELLLEQPLVIVEAHLEQTPSTGNVLFALAETGRAHHAYGA